MHSQEDHLSEFLEIEQERDYYQEQYEKVKKELDKKPKVIRTIKHKKHPIIMNPSYGINFDAYKPVSYTHLTLPTKRIV